MGLQPRMLNFHDAGVPELETRRQATFPSMYARVGIPAIARIRAMIPLERWGIQCQRGSVRYAQTPAHYRSRNQPWHPNVLLRYPGYSARFGIALVLVSRPRVHDRPRGPIPIAFHLAPSPALSFACFQKRALIRIVE
ncbi:hypothetical protein F1559_004402 [Cyanidiococcus yangmingshanensis]|uniref:Uncharacterized protein n=1 Tax=Cyanidiococcus yangmingshanensis TaxID=2690220 RepID=A0A7J7IMJ2_9RHOD|nr:hypothetical protein F1559_004402 [Cyanidiococcus yangmingshanensis]